MKLIIKKLVLHHFKGIKKIELDFTDLINSLLGANGSGKTTIYDSFLWLVVDKDSLGRKDFGIKTLTKDNKTIKDLEHTVEGYLDVDGEELILKKIYKEKWVRKRGGSEEEFIGNETEYFWNNVPIKKGVYESRVFELLANEETFRLLTDIKYFNSLTWQDRRRMLFELVEEEKIQPKDEELRKALKGKTTDELRLQLNQSKKKLLEKIDQSPIRIDEINKSLADEVEIDQLEIDKIDKELKSIDAQLSSAQKATKETSTKRINLNSRKSGILDAIQDLKDEIKEKYRSEIRTDENYLSKLRSELTLKKQNKKDTESLIQQYESDIQDYEDELASLRVEYTEENDKEFPTDELKCPTCDTPFKKEKKESLLKTFNEKKSDTLEKINNKGINIKTKKEEREAILEARQKELETFDERIKELEIEIPALETKIETSKETANEKYKQEVSDNSKIIVMMDEISDIDIELSKSIEQKDNTEIINRKNKLLDDKKAFDRQITANENRTTQLARIEEIEEERLKWLEELSGIEKLDFLLSEFIKQRINNIELQLKDLFNGVEFKMFEIQNNGGINPTCIVMRDGVPYNDLNTASRVWVSLNIISVFSRIRNLQFPIFIDNRESVTDIPETNQQVINLIVTPGKKKLTLVA